MPSHQTSPSGVSATLVKMVLALMVAIAFGIGLHRGARGHAEEAGLGVDGVAAGRPRPGRIQAMSSPTVVTFQPS